MKWLPIFLLFSLQLAYGQSGGIDSGTMVTADSVRVDTAVNGSLSLPGILEEASLRTGNAFERVLRVNPWIKTDHPVFLVIGYKQFEGKEILFYVILFLVFYLALFKTFFSNYFNNLFLIFFNTSLRQGQITDQLSQARLPSFLLNIFFVLSTGTLCALLLIHFKRLTGLGQWWLFAVTIPAILLIYVVKWVVIKFLGWLAGVQQAASSYVFVIFLVNKIMGILLLPFIVLIAFGPSAWLNTVITMAALLILMLFLSRYFKSLGAFNAKIQVTRLQLLLFILGVELLPILIIYKIVEDYLV